MVESVAGPSNLSSQELHSHLPAFAFQVVSVEEQWGQIWFMGGEYG
jgi:hypothetical protein